MWALSRFAIPMEIFITTDWYHYESILETASERLGICIRRQSCLFHMWKDLARRISDAGKEEKLDIAKRLVRYMFSQTEANLK